MLASRFGFGRLLLSVSLFASVPAVVAADNVKVQSEIPFSSKAKIRDAIKQECNLQTDLPRFISEFSNQVELVDGSLRKGGRSLKLEIVDAQATAGGPFSGGKWVTVEGVLTENGRKIGDFTANRVTAGVTNFNACSAVQRCSRAIGQDIAEWLENPKPNSTLGGH
jgi:hypothetical protein